MTKDFSDAPLTVNGIKVKPKWKWSAQHRADVAEDMRQNGSSHLRANEAEARYVEWYADKNSLTTDQARQRIEGGA